MNFSVQICPKKDLGLETEKSNVGIRINIVETLCVQIFSQTGLIFLAQICSKMDLGSEIQKNNVGIRISIAKMPCVPISGKMDNFDFFDPNLPKNGFWGQNFKNLSLDLESASFRYYVHQFSDKTDNFDFLGPNFPKNEFCGQKFKNISLDSE